MRSPRYKSLAKECIAMNDTQDRLGNGIQIFTCALPDAHSVTLLLRLGGGAAWEAASQKGITHLVEHLCFRRQRLQRSCSALLI